MKVGSRFIVSKYFHDARFANQTGVLISITEDGYHVSEVSFDNIRIRLLYEEGNVEFDIDDLIPSNQTGNRDIEFEDKLKESLVSLLERGALEISSSINTDYDGKLIETKIVLDGKEVYIKEERIFISF